MSRATMKKEKSSWLQFNVFVDAYFLTEMLWCEITHAAPYTSVAEFVLSTVCLIALEHFW